MIVIRIAAFTAAFAAIAIALLPMRAAWAAAGVPSDFTASAITGSVWSARLSDVSWRGAELGDFNAAASLIDRMGSLVVHLNSEDGPLRAASITTSSGKMIAEDIAITTTVSRFLPSLPAAALTLTGGRLELDGGACLSAGGQIATSPMDDQKLPAFDGRLECRNGQLHAIFASAGDAYSFSLAIDLAAKTSSIKVISANPAASLWLAAMGVPVAAPEVAP
ncbi:MAG: type II secretion system protein N [Hyphomonadaceae bacterium]|nr:type II secretion system protein N [Hyphomonadaceae bacterium]